MWFLRLLGAVVVAALVGAPARAQMYPVPTAVPHTTDVARLTALAIEREIHERFTRGLQAEAQSDWAAATTEFTRIIALDPPEPKGSTARYDLAIARTRAGDFAAAIRLLDDALKRDPGFTAAAANLVTTYTLAGDIVGARTAADHFIALAPASARARYERGIVALRTGDLATARTDFRALVTGDPAYAIAHYDLAVVEIRSEHFETAQIELQSALAISPDYARARFALATVYLRLGQRDAARAAFDRVAHDASDVTLRDVARDLRERL